MKALFLFLFTCLSLVSRANDRQQLDKFLDNRQYPEALKIARKIYQQDKTKDKNIVLLIRCINSRVHEIFDGREDKLEAYQLVNETLHLTLERKADLDDLKHTLIDYNTIKHKNPTDPDEILLRATFLNFYENLIWKKKVKNIKELLKNPKTYEKGFNSLKEEFTRTIHWECSEKSWKFILQDFMTLWREAFEADKEKCLEFMFKRNLNYDWEFAFPDAFYLKSPRTNSNEKNILHSKDDLTEYFSSWKKSKDPAIQLLGQMYCLHLKVFDDNNHWKEELEQLEKRTYKELKVLKSARVKRLYISILVSLNFFWSNNKFNLNKKDIGLMDSYKKTVVNIRNSGILEDETLRAYINSYSGDVFMQKDSRAEHTLPQITDFLNEQKKQLNSPDKFTSLIGKDEIKKLIKHIDSTIKYINPPDLPQIKFSKVEKLHTFTEAIFPEMKIKNDQLYFLGNSHFSKFDLNSNKFTEQVNISAYYFDVNDKYTVFTNTEKIELYSSKNKKIITLDRQRLVNGYYDGISLFKNRLFINSCSDTHSGRRILWDYDIEKDQLKRIADSADSGGKSPLDNINGYAASNGATDELNERVLFTADPKNTGGLYEYSFKSEKIKLIKELSSFAGKVVSRADSGFFFEMEYKTFSLSKNGEIENLILKCNGGRHRKGSVFGIIGSNSGGPESRDLLDDNFYFITDLDGYSGNYLFRAYPGGTHFEIISKFQDTEIDWHQVQLRKWQDNLIILTNNHIWKVKPAPPSHPVKIKDEKLKITAPTRAISDKATKLKINFDEDYEEIHWVYTSEGKDFKFVSKTKPGQRSLEIDVPILNEEYLQEFTVNATAVSKGKAVAWGRSELCSLYPAYKFKWFKEAQGPRKFCFVDFADEDSFSSLIKKGSQVTVISDPKKLAAAQVMPVAVSGRFLEKHPNESQDFIRKVTEQGLPVVIHGPCLSNPYLPAGFRGKQKLTGKFFNKVKGHNFEFRPFENWEGPAPLTHQGSGDENIKWRMLLQNEKLPLITESSIAKAKVYSVFPDLGKSFQKERYSGYFSYRILSLLSDKEDEED